MEIKHGGKRKGSGRPKNRPEMETVTISFRVYEFAADQIKQQIKNFSVLDRTKILMNLNGELIK